MESNDIQNNPMELSTQPNQKLSITSILISGTLIVRSWGAQFNNSDPMPENNFNAQSMGSNIDYIVGTTHIQIKTNQNQQCHYQGVIFVYQCKISKMKTNITNV